MKTLIVATIPTHHNSTSLRNLNLEHYNKYGSGVHQSIEDFKTAKEAKEYLKSKEDAVNDLRGAIRLLNGYEREEYEKYLKY